MSMNDIYSNEVDFELNASIIKEMKVNKPKHPETIRTVKPVEVEPVKQQEEPVEEKQLAEPDQSPAVKVEIVETRKEVTTEAPAETEEKQEQNKKPAKRGRKASK